MKKNIILARGTKGIYKDKDIKIKIGKTGGDSYVEVNKKRIKNIFGVHIHIRAGKETQIVLEKHATPKK